MSSKASFFQIEKLYRHLICIFFIIRIKKICYKALTNDTGAIRSIALGIKWSAYKYSAYAKKRVAITNNFVSYMDVWKKITQKLFEKYGNKNWISFSGHGTIFSFDNDILQKQGVMKNEDFKVLKDLGFAIIDSWLGTELNTFYKKQ